MKALHKKAIVKFFNSDIEAAKKTDSGIVIVSGGYVSDTGLYYEPQKCHIIDINDSDSIFQNGDIVYVGYEVFISGQGGQSVHNDRTIEKHDDGIVKWCFTHEIFCALYLSDYVISPDLVFVERVNLTKEEKTDLIIFGGSIDSEKQAYPAQILYVGKNLKDEGFDKGDTIFCDKNSDYNYNRIEGRWMHVIKAEDVLGIYDTAQKEMV